MKRILTFILTLTLIFSLAACAPASAPEASAEPENPPAAEQAPEIAPVAGTATEIPADEYERAIWYGFLPEELAAADPDGTNVTWAQYCGMLGRMIKLHDESAYPVWEEMTANAPDTEMKRDGAMVSLLFAAEAMGYASFNTDYPAAFQVYADKVWDNVTMNYPVFDWDTPVDLGEGCADNNHVGPAYDFCLRRMSQRSGKTLLEFDNTDDLRLEQPLTLEEAALSAIRLYESDRKVVDAERAKNGTVSAEALTAAAQLPEVAADTVPAWRGTSVALCDMQACHGRPFAAEEDIAGFADMGFNYLRLMLLWTDYSKESDGTLIFYPDTLENIDRIIEWCVKYGIHLCIDMHELPGYGFETRNVVEDAGGCERSVLVWDVFSARYADVPANALSYNLVNEPDAGYFTDETYAAFAGKLIAAIRSNDKADKLIVSDGMLDGNPDYGFAWSNACPTRTIEGLDGSVMQTMHLYPWHAAARSGFITLLNWPYEHAEPVNNYVGEQPLTLRGAFPAGTRVVLHLDTVYDGEQPIECKADGKNVASYGRDFKLGRNNCIFIGEGRTEFRYGDRDGFTVDFTVPEACSEITAGSGFSVFDIFVRIPSNSENTYPVPANEKENGFIYETGKYDTVYIRTAGVWSEKTSAVSIAGDLSYTVDDPVQADVFDMGSLRNYVEKWAAWSKETGTPVMCNEFGIPIGLPEEARVGYMRAVLDLFEEYGIPWCIYTNGLRCWSPVVTGSDVRNGYSVLPEDGSVTQKGDAWYDEPMLALFREYMD